MKKIIATALLAGIIFLTGCGVAGLYYSPGSSVYHTKRTCSGMKNPVSITYQEAMEMGLRACKKCG